MAYHQVTDHPALALKNGDVVICLFPSHSLSASPHPGGMSQSSEQDEYSRVNISLGAQSIKHVTPTAQKPSCCRRRKAFREKQMPFRGLLLLLNWNYYLIKCNSVCCFQDQGQKPYFPILRVREGHNTNLFSLEKINNY